MDSVICVRVMSTIIINKNIIVSTPDNGGHSLTFKHSNKCVYWHS